MNLSVALFKVINWFIINRNFVNCFGFCLETMNPEEVLDVVQLTRAQEELYDLLKTFEVSDDSINSFLGRYFGKNIISAIDHAPYKK